MKKSLLCIAALLATMAASASVAGNPPTTSGARDDGQTAPPPQAPITVASIVDEERETITLPARRDTRGGPNAVAGKAS